MFDISTGDVLTILFFILSSATAVILAFDRLRRKVNEAILIEKIKKDIEKEIQKISMVIDSITSSQVKSDKDQAVNADRVKGIYFKLGEFSKEVSTSLSKMELNLKNEIKTIDNNSKEAISQRRAECKDINDEIKNRINDLYEKKKDK